jgi:3-hexulose-6-phosphate synthase
MHAAYRKNYGKIPVHLNGYRTKKKEQYMKLQVALDFGTIDDARTVLHDIAQFIDIVEIGAISTEYGYSALATLKAEFPQLEYLADIKIADGGYYFAKQLHEQGADYVTVLGIVENETIEGALQASRETGIQIVADMLGCKNFLERVKELDAMGVQYISVHTPADLQATHTPFEHLKFARMIVKNAKLSVAGGIGPHNVAEVLPYKPEIIISGSALTGGNNRETAAKALRDAINKAEGEV